MTVFFLPSAPLPPAPLAPADLLALLRQRCAGEGAVPLSDFMALANHSYYGNQTAFGAGGDFITAPEISQVFGELIGLWTAVVWQSMGQPSPFRLVEAGPGRGTLIADALRATAGVPGFTQAADLHLIEGSPRLRQLQQQSLDRLHTLGHLKQGPPPCQWHNDLSTVPAGPTILLANEFLDALPVEQWEYTDAGWCRRMVAFQDGDRFTLTLAPPLEAAGQAALAEYLGPAFAAPQPGDIAELSPASEQVVAGWAKRLAEHGGMALVIDYGYTESAPGDSLQAVREHRFCPPLECPGEVDLTAHVDFARLLRVAAAAGAATWPALTQGRLLAGLGAEARGRQLMKKASPAQAMTIGQSLHRLLHPSEMGTLFKAVAFGHPHLPPPPGFEGRIAP